MTKDQLLEETGAFQESPAAAAFAVSLQLKAWMSGTTLTVTGLDIKSVELLAYRHNGENRRIMMAYYTMRAALRFPSHDIDASGYDGSTRIWGSGVPCALTLDTAVDFYIQILEWMVDDARENDINSFKKPCFSDIFDEATKAECERFGTSDGEYVPDGWTPDEWRNAMQG